MTDELEHERLFADDLAKLMKKHKVFFVNDTVKIRYMPLSKLGGHSVDSEVKVRVGTYMATDNYGPFMTIVRIDPEEKRTAPIKNAAPMIQSDYAPYQCPVSGKMIDGKSEHRENLKRHDCRILEPGESRDAQKNYERGKKERVEKITNSMSKQMSEML